MTIVDSAKPLDEIAAMVSLYREAQAHIKEWEDSAKMARSIIEQALGEHETGTVDGHPVIKWSQVRSNSLDQTLLKSMYPAIAAECTTTKTSRRFSMVRA